jgi:hypothetical protein
LQCGCCTNSHAIKLRFSPGCWQPYSLLSLASPPLSVILQDGRRDGIGIKTYADGSMYDGFWRAGKKHGLGVFRPAPPEDVSSSRRHSSGWQPGPPAAASQPQQQQPNSAVAAAAGMGVLMPCGKVADDSAVVQHEASLSPCQHSSAFPVASIYGEAAAATAAAPTSSAALAAAESTTRQHLLAKEEPTSMMPQQQQQLMPQQQSVPQRLQQPQQHQFQNGHHPALKIPVATTDLEMIYSSNQKVDQLLEQHCRGMDSAAVFTQNVPTDQGLAIGTDAAGQQQQQQQPEASSSRPGPAQCAATAAAPSAADGAAESSSPTAAVAAVAEAVAVSAAAADAAPRKLFVREYDFGVLLREYPLTAEEIKMIFGFLWPKQNKVHWH